MADVSWDELMARYESLYSECLSSEPMMGRWGEHVKGMLDLIPQIRDLSALKDASKWMSHLSLVIGFPDNEARISFFCEDAMYGIYSNQVDQNGNLREEAKASSEDVVSEILNQVKKMREV